MKKATDSAMPSPTFKVLRKNANGHKVIETNGWIKVLYANGDTRVKIPAQHLRFSGEGLNTWISENTN